MEGIISNTRDRTRNGDTGQAGAFIEGRFPDASDTVWYCDVGQAGTFIKGIISNTRDRTRNVDTGQAGAFPEGRLSDAGDRTRNDNTG